MYSVRFQNIYLGKYSGISSKNENINTDFKIDDLYFNEETFEDAEEKMQRMIIDSLLKQTKLDLIIGADLTNQLGITNMAMSNYNIPYIGVYSACASFPLGMILAGKMIKYSNFKSIGVLVSSHNLTAEKTYRYPVEYGSLRKKCETFTATGAVVAEVTSRKTNIKIESGTIGRVIDSGVTNSKNMGAVMAIGAYDTLKTHLKDLKRDISYYDLILTGDLGKIGKSILMDLLKDDDITPNRLIDSGEILLDKSLIYAGSSGPTCLPLVLLFKMIKSGYKKILIIGTGALHNQLIANREKNIPTISHAVSIEVKS